LSACTTSLVAAMTPTLPLARRNSDAIIGHRIRGLESLDLVDDVAMVVAWWSLVKIEIGIAVQPEFISSLPRRVAKPTPWAICALSWGSERHLMLVSA
jgi:hypothetical protein